MSDQELIGAYQQGQVSRRTFIRRLLTSGVSLGAALTYADVLWRQPVGMASVSDDFYCPEPRELPTADAHVHARPSDVFEPALVTVPMGSCVRWHFHARHSVRNNMKNLHSGFRTKNDFEDHYTRNFVAAGTFPYRCEHTSAKHPFMQGIVRVPMKANPQSGPLGTTFEVIWAKINEIDGSPDNFSAGPVHQFASDIQIRRPGEADFENWRTNKRIRKTTFTPQETGRFRFRARLKNLDLGERSGYSPWLTINVT